MRGSMIFLFIGLISTSNPSMAEMKTTAAVSCAATVGAAYGITRFWSAGVAASERTQIIESHLAKALPAKRALRLAKLLVKANNSMRNSVYGAGALFGVASITGIVCSFSVGAAQAATIVENPQVALNDNEDFQALAAAIGVDESVAALQRIANGEDSELVLDSVIANLKEANPDFINNGPEQQIIQ